MGAIANRAGSSTMRLDTNISTPLIGAIVTLSTIALYIAQPSMLTRLDLKIYDLLLPLRSASAPSDIPIIVDIDEASLDAYGQWPWSRYLVADLVDALQRYEVAAIGIDVLFAEPDRSSPDRVRQDLARDKGVDMRFLGLPSHLGDYDLLLSDSLSRTPSVLGVYANFGGGIAVTDEIADRARNDSMRSIKTIEHASAGAIDWLPLLPQAVSVVQPLSVLSANTPTGFINAVPDADGIVRSIPLLVRVGGEAHPALSLRTLMLAMDTNNLTLITGADGLEAVKAGGFQTAISPQGLLRLPFIGARKSYPYFSAADILRGEAAADDLRGRIAFVGTSSPGLVDLRSTPFDASYPGVEFHAAAVDAILTGNAIVIPAWTPAVQLLGILLYGVLSALAFGFARPRVYLGAAIVLLLIAVLIARELFAAGFFISPIYFMLTIALSGTLLLLSRFWQEERRRLVLQETFSRYVSPEIVRRIVATRGDLAALMAGEERELSIMFTDIRGFTTLSETLTPHEIVTLLGRYFTPMTALVRENEGTLDKFLGDGLMAYWNAPLDVPNHAAKAVSAAVSMQENLPLLNEKLRAELGLEIPIGIGIHSGRAFVGNMGSSDLVNYTLIGDNVNLASRLEELTPKYGAGVVISGETAALCGDSFAFVCLDTLRVKGKQKPVTIYQPLRHAAAEARKEELSRWDEARGRYTAGEFEEARRLLGGLCEEFADTLLYAVFYERVERLIQSPREKWDGVWVLTTK
ncbi:guanylate cyclase [Campylobacterota bacterium]|nr:guanylate cyclase [Campylobacterota bacterium]